MEQLDHHGHHTMDINRMIMPKTVIAGSRKETVDVVIAHFSLSSAMGWGWGKSPEQHILGITYDEPLKAEHEMVGTITGDTSRYVLHVQQIPFQAKPANLYVQVNKSERSDVDEKETDPGKIKSKKVTENFFFQLLLLLLLVLLLLLLLLLL